MAAWNNLPPETQLMVLEQLANAQCSKLTSRKGLAIYACVCKSWQSFFEQKIFRHFILGPLDIAYFDYVVTSHRRKSVKHILLRFDGCSSPYHQGLVGISPGVDISVALPFFEDSIEFTQVLKRLFLVLSRWETQGPNASHGLTLELGADSSLELSTTSHLQEDISLYSEYLQTGSLEASKSQWDTRLEYAGRFERPPPNPVHGPGWRWGNTNLLGFLGITLGSCFEQSPLPQVEVVTGFLIRLWYFRNFAPRSLAEIFKSLPRLESIHFERWRYGRQESDQRWDRFSWMISANLPSSLRNLTIYEESNTAFHQQSQSSSFKDPRLDLSRAVFRASHSLEQLFISFHVDAEDFLRPFWPSADASPEPQHRPDWEFLTSIALTATALASGSSATANKLLLISAVAATKMPKLRLLELWDRSDQATGVFRYETTQDATEISWQGTWDLCISEAVLHNWTVVAFQHSGGRHELQFRTSRFLPGEVEDIGSLFQYLKLGKHLLHDVSVRQLEKNVEAASY